MGRPGVVATSDMDRGGDDDDDDDISTALW
jgi:hypothetical protein